MSALHRTLKFTPLAALCAVALPALATNGYFPHGYGMKALGMGGASAALAQDSMGGATNPAGMVWAGSRMDLGVSWFSPRRDAERSGAGFTPINGKVTSDSTSFFIPEFGYNRMVRPDLALGLTVYGNGGMNTDYPQGPFQCPAGPTTLRPGNMLCGSGSLGVDLSQLIVAPNVAYKLNAQHAIGASLLLGYQRFKAEGLQAFDNPPGFPPFTGAPGSVTNNGYDSSTGVGIRLGYQGHLNDMVSIGAAYAPKMHMGKFDKYKGLFAGQGGFDIPAHYSVGIAIMPAPAWTFAIDFGRIEYGDVASVGNPSSNQAPLGADNGPGFGWKSINVVKIGASWRASETWTLRAGYNRGDNPIGPQDVSFNILAPGVMKDHWTAGFTYAFDKVNEITGAAMYAPRQTVTGASLFNSPGLFGPGGGGNETIGMKQYQLGVAWGHKF
jgi:long-chain fatty acid transport protein